jgi:hypothetical protein
VSVFANSEPKRPFFRLGIGYIRFDPPHWYAICICGLIFAIGFEHWFVSDMLGRSASSFIMIDKRGYVSFAIVLEFDRIAVAPVS